jgi:hypothetical protein
LAKFLKEGPVDPTYLPIVQDLDTGSVGWRDDGEQRSDRDSIIRKVFVDPIRGGIEVDETEVFCK